MNLTPETRVGEIATRHPLATRVFARHGIDFCCGGGVALAKACAKRGLDTTAVLREIEQTIATPSAEDTRRWDGVPVAQLVHHIVEHYHVPLREELPRLESMARKVFRVHGDKDPAQLGGLLEAFLELQKELGEHLQAEEETLFPAILARDAEPAPPLAPLIDDHSRVGLALRRIRELTNDFTVPEGACNTWNALWHGLAALETELHQHIHLENNILFPQVRAA